MKTTQAPSKLFDQSTSILIAGAGPVGMTAAIELRRRGFSPRVIDQAAGPAGESRALAIHGRTLDILEPSGVTPKLLAAGHPIRGASFGDAQGEFLRLDFSHARQQYNYVLLLPQNETEQILQAHLNEMGISVEWNTSLVGLRQSDNQMHCEIEGPVGKSEHEFAIVVGSDGSHSFVRKSLGIEFEGSAYEHDWSLADIHFSEERPLDEMRVKVLDDGVLGFFPLTPHSGRFVYSGTELMAIVEHEVQATEVAWESSFRISHRIVESYQQGNVFLAGDAAHIHSPAGGRGMNLGIEDAATLAWLIERGETDRYTGLRLPIGRKVLHFTDTQTRQMLTKNPVLRWLRRHVAPLAMKSKTLQRVAFRRLSGADTPPPEWLV